MKALHFFSILAALLIHVPGAARAANPFLQAPDDQPRAVMFSGTEWGDHLAAEEFPLSAWVLTTRIAKLPWGAVFKITFQTVDSKADEKRQIAPLHFIATDERIVRLNEEDIDTAIARLAALPREPAFDQAELVGLSDQSRVAEHTSIEAGFAKGAARHTTRITLNGDLCTFRSSHNSGHSTSFVWKKGHGLVAHSSNYGARRDGYSLKRMTAPTRKKP